MEHSGKLRKVGVELLWRALTFWRWVIAEDKECVCGDNKTLLEMEHCGPMEFLD